MQENQAQGSVLQQMTMGKNSAIGFGQNLGASARNQKFIVQCLTQHGELQVFKIDLMSKQIQLLIKLRFEHIQNSNVLENVVDHLIHQGSFSYSISLTDQGNVHIHHIYGDQAEAYRGTIQVTRGSQKIVSEQTGLYLAVLSPCTSTPSFGMCQDVNQKRFLRAQ